jgi:hypothetical protein
VTDALPDFFGGMGVTVGASKLTTKNNPFAVFHLIPQSLRRGSGRACLWRRCFRRCKSNHFLAVAKEFREGERSGLLHVGIMSGGDGWRAVPKRTAGGVQSKTVHEQSAKFFPHFVNGLLSFDSLLAQPVP